MCSCQIPVRVKNNYILHKFVFCYMSLSQLLVKTFVHLSLTDVQLHYLKAKYNLKFSDLDSILRARMCVCLSVIVFVRVFVCMRKRACVRVCVCICV